MQIIFGEKCVSLLRLFFAAVLMLWCAQTAAYSGQCHTTQGNPYIGVNFGVKTLEEEANTAGVVKDKFYQWNESNDYYVSCDCDKDNVRSGRWAFAADSPLVYLGDNWYKINDYLAAKVLLQVKGSSPTAVPFENVGTGGDTRWHICDPGGQRLGGQGASGNSGSFSLKIFQPFVGSVVIPPMALARLYECYNIGDVSLTRFSHGNYGPEKSFIINLQDCGTDVSTVDVTFSGTPDGVQSEMLSIESGTDAASGLAIAILDDAKILIPLNQASKDYSLHSGKVPLTFYAQLRPVNSDVQSGKVNASATFVLHYD